MDFKRPVFAMAVLQAPFSLTHWLTDLSFSYCVSHVVGPVSAFFWKVWYQWSFPLPAFFKYYFRDFMFTFIFW